MGQVKIGLSLAISDSQADKKLRHMLDYGLEFSEAISEFNAVAKVCFRYSTPQTMQRFNAKAQASAMFEKLKDTGIVDLNIDDQEFVFEVKGNMQDVMQTTSEIARKIIPASRAKGIAESLFKDSLVRNQAEAFIRDVLA